MRRRRLAGLCALLFGLIAVVLILDEMGILSTALTTGEISLRFGRHAALDVSPYRYLSRLIEHMLRIVLASVAAGYAFAYAFRYDSLQRFQRGLMARFSMRAEPTPETAGD